jgi:subtilase family serine protease
VPPPATTVPPPSNTPRPADLLVTDIVGETSVTIPTGETSATRTYSITISNNGDSNTGQFNNSIQIIPGGVIQELGVVGNLGPGESVALSIDLTFDAVGSFTLQVDADHENAVVETSEFNNRGTEDVEVLAES